MRMWLPPWPLQPQRQPCDCCRPSRLRECRRRGAVMTHTACVDDVSSEMGPQVPLLALLFAAACAPAAGATSPGTGPLCVSSGSGVTDYFPSKVTVSDLPSSSTTVVLNATTVRVKTQTAREPGCLGGGRHSSSRPGPAPA